MTDKIMESIFFQFTFNLLLMTLTKKIITQRVSKIHKWIRGMCMNREKLFKE